MSNKTVKTLVLQGGDSSEREVSFRSAAAVIAALKRSGYTTIDVYDPKDGLEGLITAARKADVVLPIIHGENCEDGTIQKELEKLDIPFLGAGSEASQIAINKERTHTLLEGSGITMPTRAIVTSESFHGHELSSKPFVLKPIEGGSSVDCIVARDVQNLDQLKITELLSRYNTMLLEELIEGQEITVGVLASQPLPIVAIFPPENAEFDYENKYNGASREVCPVPQSLITDDLQKQAQEIALKVHSAIGARHLSRTDMIIRPSGEIVVLELNTIPGLTDQSLYPKEALAIGISMEQLVERFLEMALAN